MHLYSHLVIAHALIPRLRPGDLDEYRWGAVVPDIRYLAGMRRRQTHPAIPAVRAWLEQAPALRDFSLGYLVHVLADERDAAGTLYARIPLRALRRRLPRSLAAVLLEAAYAEKAPLEARVSGSYNPLLAELGVAPAFVAPFALAANRYAAAPSTTTALEMMAELGLSDAGGALAPSRQARLQRYLRWARWLEGHPSLRRALLSGIDLPGITRRIVADLERQLEILHVD